jgi:hypothetical protein
VPRTHLTRLASDHLPIVAELALPAEEGLVLAGGEEELSGKLPGD